MTPCLPPTSFPQGQYHPPHRLHSHCLKQRRIHFSYQKALSYHWASKVVIFLLHLFHKNKVKEGLGAGGMPAGSVSQRIAKGSCGYLQDPIITCEIQTNKQASKLKINDQYQTRQNEEVKQARRFWNFLKNGQNG